MTQAEIDQVIEVLTSVKDHMTCRDVYEEFGYPIEFIRRICKDYNITLLSHRERNMLYIHQVCGRLTTEQIARKLGLGEDYVRRMAQAAGVILLEPEMPLFIQERRIDRKLNKLLATAAHSVKEEHH